MSPTVDGSIIAIRSTYHTVLKSTHGATIFGMDMLFNIPYVADWKKIGCRRQEQVECTNKYENSRCLPHDYATDEGHYMITQMHCNGTVRI